jgi:hypothetical protein
LGQTGDREEREDVCEVEGEHRATISLRCSNNGYLQLSIRLSGVRDSRRRMTSVSVSSSTDQSFSNSRTLREIASCVY